MVTRPPSFEDHAGDFFFSGLVREVAQLDIKLALLEDAAVMGEGVKALFAVVAAHAGLANTAEGHVRACKVNDGIVDAAATETAGAKKLFLCGFIFTEKIKSQRMWM